MRPPLRCRCGSEDWISCAPGTDRLASPYSHHNVRPLHPTKAVPLRAWCRACWPWAPKAAPVDAGSGHSSPETPMALYTRDLGDVAGA
jgi:hypothetical protein